MEEIERRKSRFLLLQKRLKEERLFVKNEKEQLRNLNKKISNLTQDLFHLEWKTRQQWINVDRLVWGGRSNPHQCSVTSRIIESVAFEDAASHLNYEDRKYGDFLLSLKENPRLVALILDFCDNKRIQSSTMDITRLLLSSLYGSCAQKKDEIIVLKILKELMYLQVIGCEDLLDFFCGKRSADNAFVCVLTLFSETLFSSKLYLTAALHGTVMQVIVDDAIFLDVEVSKVLSRIPPSATKEKFGNPGTMAAQNKIKDHMNLLHNHLIRLSNKFLKSLQDKIYCFPQSLRWAICQLYEGMISQTNLPSTNAKALIGHILMSYFICPAIINPEPFGINSDADISETARHNLGQIAGILRSLALLDCGLKDEKLKDILDGFEKGLVINYVSNLLIGSESIMLEEEDEISKSVVKCALLMTEHDLKTLIKCVTLLQSYNISMLRDAGLNQLLALLPSSQWLKDKPTTKSPPTNTRRLIDIDLPVPPPRHKQKVHSYSTTEMDNDLQQLRSDLNKKIDENSPVLVISLSNEVDSLPGMLPEEKVLNKADELTNEVGFDLEVSKNERNRRASTLMLNALRESLPDVQTEQSSLDVIRSKSTASSRTTDQLDSVLLNTNENCSVVHNLVSLTDSEEDCLPELPIKRYMASSRKKSKESVPELPAKKVNQILFDEPLISLENEIFKENATKLLSPGNESNTISSTSSEGGINAILQSAAVPSPTSVKSAVFTWSPINNLSTDPWGVSSITEVADEVTENTFENSFITEVSGKDSPSTKKRSIDPAYDEYTKSVQRKAQYSISESDDFFTHDKRKKSWFKDKILSINTGFKQGRKGMIASDSKKNLSAVKVGTPLEASNVTKPKSLPIATKNAVDAGEDILAKYRTLAFISPGVDSPLAASPTNSTPTYKEEVVVFDQEFKFNDSKKKLRTVLCTTDQMTLPSSANTFDHLLLTMLQAKLAEAINLQDRYSVAQLHETLRSIKQLPKGSCENLICKLEEDYQERFKYISYLVQSKKGLLSVLSYLDQITAKLERDKKICQRYFTTLSVRLYLETPERKRNILAFSQRFGSNKMLDEKSAMLNEFLEELHNDMMKEPTWVYSNDVELEEILTVTERAIMSRIYREAFYPNNVADMENDRIFHDHIKTLSKIITLSHPTLRIPKMYQKEAPWPSAQTELLMINAYKTAADKLSCVHRCCVTIMNLLSMASEKQAPGADDFVPVLVYVVLRANPPNLLSTKQYVNTFYETRLSGEEYYCWMQFCAAIEFIKTLRAPERKP